MPGPSRTAPPEPPATSSLSNAQAMKASPVMLIERITLYLLLVLLAQSNKQVQGLGATNCSAEIQVKRHSWYKTHTGASLTMECPVQYCGTKPSVQWCKMERDTCVGMEEGTRRWESDFVYTLEISPVHQNHSGRFRCRAEDGTLSIESHDIKVSVEEEPINSAPVSPESTTSISEESQEPGSSQMLLITYASAPVGLCCLLIAGCTVFWCLKRCHVKKKRTPLTQQREDIMVRSPAAAPFQAAGTSQAPEESSSLYCSMASPLQALKDNIIYDNAVPPWKAQRTAPKAPCSNPVTPSIPVLPESPDGLTYAVLNHSAPAQRCQRREQSVVNEFTEYACINVHQ